MKICPKCEHSFAEGFKYCPKDATELVRYDLRSTLQAQGELQFLFVHDSLAARLKNEIAAAVIDAMQAALLIRFNPAIKDGRPVSVRANLEFNFALY